MNPIPLAIVRTISGSFWQRVQFVAFDEQG